MGLGAGVFQVTGVAQDKTPPKEAPKTPMPFKDQKENMSYGIGMSIGGSLKPGGVDLDIDLLAAAIKDVLAGRETKMTQQQSQEAVNSWRMAASAKRTEEQHKLADKNKKEGAAFLAENAKKPGVNKKTVTLPDGKTAELQYKVLTDGTGPMPGSNDTVSVFYRGAFIDGKEFDSSSKRGTNAATFPVKGVVRGWTEALQMMKVGSKWQVYLPSDLAYGDNGRPGIEPGATLIFDMELAKTEPPAPPPPPPQPLTSDIIKVPSKEEMDKGAKIEVIKPEEAARLAAEQAKQAKEKK